MSGGGIFTVGPETMGNLEYQVLPIYQSWTFEWFERPTCPPGSGVKEPHDPKLSHYQSASLALCSAPYTGFLFVAHRLVDANLLPFLSCSPLSLSDRLYEPSLIGSFCLRYSIWSLHMSAMFASLLQDKPFVFPSTSPALGQNQPYDKF